LVQEDTLSEKGSEGISTNWISGLSSASKVKYCFPDECSIPEKIIVCEKIPDPVPITDTDNRGFERIAPMLSEHAYRIRVPDIYLTVKNALLIEDTFEFFTLRVFFLRIENHFCHNVPTPESH
jgi:hypothetical protein